MKSKPVKQNDRIACSIPRKQKAIEALLLLAWKKEKKERPRWLIEDLSHYS